MTTDAQETGGGLAPGSSGGDATEDVNRSRAVGQAPEGVGLDVALVLNRHAGTLRGLNAERTAEEIAEVFRAAGHRVRLELHSGRSAAEAIERICRGKACDAIVVGGGDGTVSAAAAAAARSGLALGILPLGTMNLFARSLGIPLDLRLAAAALASGKVGAVDIGVANGRHFVHHVTFGLHPRMIRVRERLNYASRLGKIVAALRAWWLVVRNPPRLVARIGLDEGVVERRTAAILVTNNPVGEGHLPYADDLRQGRLGVYVTTSRRRKDLVQLFARMTLSGISESALLERRLSRRVEISLPERVINASLDGELVTLETPVLIELRKDGLRVIHPATASTAPA